MKNFLLLLSFVLLWNTCKKDTPSPQIDNEEIVVLISLDGFRHDYFDFTATPALDELISDGVKADGLIPVFPSKTFPNHYTQVTGLYPENHGIISNTMYDSIFNDWFFIGNGSVPVTEGRWYEGEPVWATAKKNGIKSATYFWIGSEAEIGGYRPDYYFPFNSNTPYPDRVEQVLDWIKMSPNQRPRMITLYFSAVDGAGHGGGPNSSSVISAIESVDQQIGDLMQGIKDQGKEDQVNVIVVSDHGMAQLSRDSMVFLDDYISMDDVVVVNYTPNLDIVPKEGKEESVYQALKDAHPKMKIYKKTEIPDSLHYKNHRRITPIVGYADNEWSIITREIFDNNPNAFKGGTHGYLPSYRDMHGVFVARGPSFKSGFSKEAFSSIHLYELMCKILEITPAANDGNLSEVEDVLK